MRGVTKVVVGYTGGSQPWPNYDSIEDHTEAVRITFDPTTVTYEEILDSYVKQNSSIFAPSWMRQYRSAIMVHNEDQRKAVKAKIESTESYTGQKVYIDIEMASDFYLAEEYHQKWIEKNNNKRNKWI